MPGSSPQIPETAGRAAVEAFLEHADSCSFPALQAALKAAYPHLLTAFSEALLADPAQFEGRYALMRGNENNATVEVRVETITKAMLATLNVSGGEQ